MESVTEHFKKWGPLLNVKVLKDWMQRPYSFVQFEVGTKEMLDVWTDHD